MAKTNWEKHVFSVSFSIYPRQIELILNYKKKHYITSRSDFVRNAIDHYTLRFEEILALTEKKAKEEVEKTDDEFLKENGITILREA